MSSRDKLTMPHFLFQRLTQIRYLPSSTTSKSVTFQIWNETSPGNLGIRAILTAEPINDGVDIKVLTAPVAIEIDVGDLIGVYVDHSYPIGTIDIAGLRDDRITSRVSYLYIV